MVLVVVSASAQLGGIGIGICQNFGIGTSLSLFHKHSQKDLQHPLKQSLPSDNARRPPTHSGV